MPEDYETQTAAPDELSDADLKRCVDIVAAGGAVGRRFAEAGLKTAKKLVLLKRQGSIVGVGSAKNAKREYIAGVVSAKKSNFQISPDAMEIGYVAIDPLHRGKHLSLPLMAALLDGQAGSLIATTDHVGMKKTLSASGFIQRGSEWKGARGRLSLWVKDS